MTNILKNIFSVFSDENHKNKHFKVFKMLGLELRFQIHKKIRGKNNKIFLKKDGNLEELNGTIPGLFIFINGENNKIILEEPYKFVNSAIICEGQNNTVIIESTKYTFEKLSVDIGHNQHNRKVHIKKNVSVVEVEIFCWAAGGTVTIGEDCMISCGVVISNGDGHKITKPNSPIAINIGYNCEIGNHVWIAQRTYIGKNVKINDNNIIGACSVVTKSFNENNVVIAGNPARIVKEDVEWHR